MPGFLSKLFAADDAAAPRDQDTDAAAEHAVDASLAIGVEHDVGGAYESGDGSSGSWTNETDLDVELDFSAMLASVTAVE